VAKEGRFKVGLQMWFHTPAFLIDMFRQVNPMVEVVSSDLVMDPLRMIKEPEELALLTEAQRIAGLGMDRARSCCGGCVGSGDRNRGHVRNDAGRRRGHEHADLRQLRRGNLHASRQAQPCAARARPAGADRPDPTVDGYCANLARSFVLGEPDTRQAALIAAYRQIVADVRSGMRPEQRSRN